MGMTERDRVLDAFRNCITEPKCKDCPWTECETIGNGTIEIPRDLALAVMRELVAQEPRVMGVGDLYGADMGFYERKGEELVWPVLIARGGPDDDGTVGIVRKDAFEIKADCGLINQTWRIWTAYPTEAEREAVKWE